MRRITERDRTIYSCYLENGSRIKPTVAHLRTVGYPRITAEGVRQVVAKVKSLMNDRSV